MRELKFRGYATGIGWVFGSLVNNLWTYSEYSQYKKGSPVYEIITGEYDGDCWHDIIEQEGTSIISVVPDSIGQFTGLKDKNGKDVYEGDILSDWIHTDEGIRQSFRQVFWSEKGGCWKLDCSNSQNKSYSYLLSNELKNYKYEVVGNIHEKPELLK